MKCVVLSLFLVAGWVLLQPANCQTGNITIIGNERPFIDGIQQDVTCIFNGQNSVSTIRWKLVLGNIMATIVEASGVNELVLSVNPELSNNGSQFKCEVVDSLARMYMETITIIVKDLEHTLNVTASHDNPVIAGTTLTLTCIAVTSRPVHLQWLDSDNSPVNSTSSISVPPPLVVEQITTITLTFDPLKTSHAGLYTCSCDMPSPTSIVTASHKVVVQIPDPTVSVARKPPPSELVSTGDRLVMTCTAVVSDHVDTPTEVETSWTDRSSLSDSPRVTVSPTSTSPPYDSSVTISSLVSSDTGTYICCVQVLSMGNPCANDSEIVCQSIEISASLSVEITIDHAVPYDYEYASPPYYRPCTPITLNCVALRASGIVSYTWTSSNSASFVSGRTSGSVSIDMLTYLDGGAHTCCVYDGEGNTGCDRTEIFIKGYGLYIDDSEYISGVAVPNNSIAVPKSASCSNCKLDVYCCSDTTAATMGFVFPDGVLKETAGDYYNMAVVQDSGAARVRMHNYLTDHPQLTGLYCCRIVEPDGEALTASVAVYTSLPGAPRVYSKSFTYDPHSNSDYVIKITCSTSDSPPTEVEWFRNDVSIDVEDVSYTAVQMATDRRNLYYDNVLFVKDPCLAAGTHQFECRVTNTQGSTTHSITTNVPAYNVTEIRVSEGTEFAGDRLVLTCVATLPWKLKDLLPFVKIEWVGPPGVDADVGGVTYSDCGLSRTLTFDPLRTDHSGLYRCVLSITKEELAEFFAREIRHDVAVITRALFQLQFGPVSDCTTWVDQDNMVRTLESNIKTAMTAAINEYCSCGFHDGLIDMGEMSCHSSCSSNCKTAVYRARLTATVYTAEQLLGMVQEWLTSDGTFLFTHFGRIRLRVNPHCQPLLISSFSEPECGLSVADINSKIF